MQLRLALDRAFHYSGGQKHQGTAIRSVEEVARFLSSLGNEQVHTDLGTYPARIAAKLVLTGKVSEIHCRDCYVKVLPGGKALVMGGTENVAKGGALPGSGTSLTYGEHELDLIRLADLLAAMGVETYEEYAGLWRDPVATVVRAIEAVESRRGTASYDVLRSELLNLVEILADAMLAREENDPSSFSTRLRKHTRSGEFDEVSDHVKQRLHVSRTAIRAMMGNLRPVYKIFAETGRHYVIVLDKSGSMGELLRGGDAATTKKAMAALVAMLIMKNDPDSKFSLVAFDDTGYVLAKRKTVEEVIDKIIDIEPSGGTSYPSGLKGALSCLDEGDVLVIIGDFLDHSAIPQHIADEIRSKASRVLVIPVGAADLAYARYVAQTLGGDVYVYRDSRLVLLEE